MIDPTVLFAILIVLLLASLIGFRLGRAVAMDDVGRPLRDWTVRVKAGKPRSRPRRWLVGLFKCPHCIGFWFTLGASFIVSAVMLDVDWPVDIIIALAASGAQSLFTTRAQAEKVDLTIEDEQPEQPE